MIVGAQKCGTTALFRYLEQHPEIGMSSQKEVHLFDAPDYSPDWTPDQIDDRYRPYFRHCPRFGRADSDVATHARTLEVAPASAGPPASQGTPVSEGSSAPLGTLDLEGARSPVRVRGEATPIYMFLPEIAGELKRYNPGLKLIVLLRDPVERALSHFYMEKNRGNESLPLLPALTLEPWRLRRCDDARRHGSAWQCHSYRSRGLYSRQLANLYRHFGREQVLLVRSEHLARDHNAALQRVFDFLGVGPHPGIEAHRVFAGARGAGRHTLVSWLLRASYLLELARMRRLGIAPVVETN